MKNELKKFQKVWSSDDLECLDRQSEDEVLDGEEESREAFLKITLHFLRKMKQEDLAECLQSSKRMFHTSLFYINTNIQSLICCVFIQELLLRFVDVNSNLT